jgi:hypothetical protein
VKFRQNDNNNFVRNKHGSIHGGHGQEEFVLLTLTHTTQLCACSNGWANFISNP